MKIVVCIKQVVDTLGSPIQLDMSTNRLPVKLNYIVNPVDENATEEALRLRERYGGEVIVVSAGPARVERALRVCLAMGADRAIRMWHPALEVSDAYVIAQLLSRALGSLDPDLILCGCRSLDEGTGQVPPALAELLDLPQVTGVSLMEVSPTKGSVSVHRKLEKGHRQKVECILPALISVESSINRPRYPTLRSILQAQKKPIVTLDAKALGDEQLDCPIQFVSLTPARRRPKKTSVINSNLSVEERLKQIMSGGITEKEEVLWEGTPEELAARLVKLLRQEGFFPPRTGW